MRKPRVLDIRGAAVQCSKHTTRDVCVVRLRDDDIVRPLSDFGETWESNPSSAIYWTAALANELAPPHGTMVPQKSLTILPFFTNRLLDRSMENWAHETPCDRAPFRDRKRVRYGVIRSDVVPR